jgi:peptidoglycan/xylan/chitin deacetylase (PgdA/CDA1 family)
MDKQAVGNLLLSANAFAPLRFWNREKLPVLMYHRFSRKSAIGKTSVEALKLHLRYLTRHYQIISLTEAAARLKDGVDLPIRSAVITVDDGYRDFYDLAFPVLKSFSVPATVYLVTGFVAGENWIWTDKARWILMNSPAERVEFEIEGKVVGPILGDAASRLRVAAMLNSELKKLPDEQKDAVLDELAGRMKVTVPDRPADEFAALDPAQVRELAAGGIEIGSHTHSHPILTNIGEERLETELRRSLDSIRQMTQIDDVHFCYPNGNVSPRERDAVEAAGYASSVTTRTDLCENNEDVFMIPRIAAEPELYRFAQATSGFDHLKGRFRSAA